MFGRHRRKGGTGASAEEEVDRIVKVRLLRATRRTEKLLRRIDALEQRVGELEGRVGRAESKGGRRRVPGDEEGEGARIVASQMLDSGVPADRVAEHLDDLYDLPDSERVVEELASDDQ